jgi:NAD(P)-dependent dehydrogenase (short-subunit alcohol dehydrogenase family)
MSLTNQRDLILGGSSGIGLATAKAALDAGAIVTIASRSETKLAAASGALGEGVLTAPLDTRDLAAVERFLASNEPWDNVVISAAQTPRRSGPPA